MTVTFNFPLTSIIVQSLMAEFAHLESLIFQFPLNFNHRSIWSIVQWRFCQSPFNFPLTSIIVQSDRRKSKNCNLIIFQFPLNFNHRSIKDAIAKVYALKDPFNFPLTSIIVQSAIWALFALPLLTFNFPLTSIIVQSTEWESGFGKGILSISP